MSGNMGSISRHFVQNVTNTCILPCVVHTVASIKKNTPPFGGMFSNSESGQQERFLLHRLFFTQDWRASVAGYSFFTTDVLKAVEQHLKDIVAVVSIATRICRHILVVVSSTQ